MQSRTALMPRTEHITPEMAEQWLANQFGGQRNLREHHVIQLAGEMERGTFVPHNAVTFAVINGEKYLIDGQHRLSAIALHGEAVSMPILEIPAKSMSEVRQLYGNIDQGLKRSATDAIRAMGLSDEFGLAERRVQRMSGALRVIATRFTDTTAGGSRSEAKRKRAVTRSNAVNTKLLRAWQSEIHHYYGLVDGGEPSNIALFDRAAVLACALLTIRYAPQYADDFWREAAHEDGLGKHDPRKRFIVQLREARKLKSGEIARLFALAWKHYLNDNEIKFLRVKTSTPLEIERIDLDQVEDDIHSLIANVDSDEADLLSRNIA